MPMGKAHYVVSSHFVQHFSAVPVVWHIMQRQKRAFQQFHSHAYKSEGSAHHVFHAFMSFTNGLHFSLFRPPHSVTCECKGRAKSCFIIPRKVFALYVNSSLFSFRHLRHFCTFRESFIIWGMRMRKTHLSAVMNNFSSLIIIMVSFVLLTLQWIFIEYRLRSIWHQWKLVGAFRVVLFIECKNWGMRKSLLNHKHLVARSCWNILRYSGWVKGLST